MAAKYNSCLRHHDPCARNFIMCDEIPISSLPRELQEILGSHVLRNENDDTDPVIGIGSSSSSRKFVPYTSYLSQIDSKSVDGQELEQNEKNSDGCVDSDDDVIMWVEKPTVISLVSSEDESSGDESNNSSHSTKLDLISESNNQQNDNNCNGSRQENPLMNAKVLTDLNERTTAEPPDSVSKDSDNCVESSVTVMPDCNGTSGSANVVSSKHNTTADSNQSIGTTSSMPHTPYQHDSGRSNKIFGSTKCDGADKHKRITSELSGFKRQIYMQQIERRKHYQFNALRDRHGKLLGKDNTSEAIEDSNVVETDSKVYFRHSHALDNTEIFISRTTNLLIIMM